MDKQNIVLANDSKRSFCNKTIRVSIFSLFFFLLLLLLTNEKASAEQYGAFRYRIQNNEVAITGFDSTYSGAVTIPVQINNYTVTAISDYAFSDCTKITCVNLHNNIVSIGSSAFKNCISLKEIRSMFQLEEIGSNAFENCIALQGRFSFGSVMRSIGRYAFKNCEKLSEISFISQQTNGSDDVSLSIGWGAFYNCCSLKTVLLPGHLKELNYETFLGCSNLKTILIPPGVNKIAYDAVGYNAYYSYQDKSQNKINGFQIMGVSGSAAEEYAKSNGFIFNSLIHKDGFYYFIANNEAYLASSDIKNGELVIPSKLSDCPVTYILSGAFFECQISSLSIPASVKEIEMAAFSHCPQLKTVTISGSNLTVSEFSFSLCANLETIILKQSVKRVLGYAFMGCTKLSNISLCDGILEIGEGTFFKDAELTRIIIPESVSWIGQFAFLGCNKLKSFTFLGNNLEIADYAIGVDENGQIIKGIVVNGSEGSTAQKYCEALNIQYNSKHRFSDWVVTKAANCQSTGSKQRVCNDCGFRETALIGRAGHQYKVKSIQKATLSQDGFLIKKCSVCSVEVSEKLYHIKSVKLSKSKYSYSGKTRKPSAIVSDAQGKKLILGQDFTVKYSGGRVECGTYKVTVTMIGSYSGTKNLRFKVVPARVTGIRQISKSGICLDWSDVKGATGYEVWVLDAAKGKYQLLINVKKPCVGNTSAKGTMRFKIRAYRVVKNKAYYGTFSDVFVAKAQ